MVVLKDALGYSFEEIADAVGMPVGTAKCHAHRGRNRLRERLGRPRRGMSLPAAPFGRDVIESIIPHRPPFLLVDEIVELEPGKRVVGRRLIRADDWWFPGHFPERPVMPGVLTIEAIAQCGAVAVLADEANRGKMPFFAGIDDCRFKRIVEPGDVLTLECEFVRVRGPIAKGEGRASASTASRRPQAKLTVFVGDAAA